MPKGTPRRRETEKRVRSIWHNQPYVQVELTGEDAYAGALAGSQGLREATMPKRCSLEEYRRRSRNEGALMNKTYSGSDNLVTQFVPDKNISVARRVALQDHDGFLRNVNRYFRPQDALAQLHRKGLA